MSISVFQGAGRDSRVCSRIFENKEEPVFVVAGIRLTSAGTHTLRQQVRGQLFLCISQKHKADPIRLPLAACSSGSFEMMLSHRPLYPLFLLICACYWYLAPSNASLLPSSPPPPFSPHTICALVKMVKITPTCRNPLPPVFSLGSPLPPRN